MRWHEGRVAFGHLRFSILDLTEASNQPMLTADGTGVLVYNGEVYNYREYAKTSKATALSSGDAEVVLQALHQMGGLGVPSSDLMACFALAYFDRRENALWLARDRVGIKSLLVANMRSELIGRLLSMAGRGPI
jgi:asparagine synthase (glutamine-hydrolysing)